MRRRRTIRALVREERGVVATEFLFIAVPLLFVTLALIDFGWLTLQSVGVEKSAQLGARIAAVSDPVAPELASFSGLEDGNSTAGDSCAAASGGINPSCDHETIICDSNGCSGTIDDDPVTFDATTFDRIFEEMRRVYGGLEREQVQIEYRASPLGFVGRPGNAAGTFNLVPMVTVRIVDVPYQFVAIGALFGFGAIQLPQASATLPGEDLDHTTTVS